MLTKLRSDVGCDVGIVFDNEKVTATVLGDGVFECLFLLGKYGLIVFDFVG